MANQQASKTQELIMNNREKINLNGVQEVLSYDNNIINLKTNYGFMEINGTDLKLSHLELTTNDIIIKGIINEIRYLEKEKGKNFFKKIFK